MHSKKGNCICKRYTRNNYNIREHALSMYKQSTMKDTSILQKERKRTSREHLPLNDDPGIYLTPQKENLIYKKGEGIQSSNTSYYTGVALYTSHPIGTHQRHIPR